MRSCIGRPGSKCFKTGPAGFVITSFTFCSAISCNGPQVNTLAFFSEALHGAVMCLRSGAESVNLLTKPIRLLRSVKLVGAGKSVMALMNFGSCFVPSPLITYPANVTSGPI